LVCAPRAVAARDPPRTPFPSASVHLPNGLGVVVIEDHTLPVVALQMVYRLDGALSTEGLHLLAPRLMLDSTKHVRRGQYSPLLAAAGARSMSWGATMDRTYFTATVPSNRVDLPLWLWSEQMAFLAPQIDAPMLARAKSLAIQDRRMRVDDVACAVAEAEARSALYLDSHPYRTAPHGVPDSIERVDLDEVRRYLESVYVPQRAAVFFVGDITPEDAVTRVAKWFGDVPPGKPVSFALPESLPSTGTQIVVHANVEAPRLRISWRIPRELDHAFQWEAFEQLLDGNEVQLLVWKFRDELKLVSSITASYTELKLGSVFSIEATVAQGKDPGELLAKIDEFLAKVVDAERSRTAWAVREVARKRAFDRETTAARATILAREWALARPEEDPATVEHFNAATILQLVGLALVPDHRVVIRCDADAGAPIAGVVVSRTADRRVTP
jgi:predicted Zn-dependent peptidase